jgi:RNA polymerase sigma-70 factor (ECF subfamily)
MMFEDIYFAHHKMVFNIALQYVQRIEDAEEIVQDVFVKVHDNIESYKSESSIKTWIYRIAINQCLDFIKHNQSLKRRFHSSLLSLEAAESNQEAIHFNHPGTDLEQKESYRILFEAINHLPDHQKTALILLKIEGMSQAEAAHIMNISVKALESLFQRSKHNLEIRLQLNNKS